MKAVQQMLAEADAEVLRISAEDAKGLPDRPDVTFLDVRESDEVAASGLSSRHAEDDLPPLGKMIAASDAFGFPGRKPRLD